MLVPRCSSSLSHTHTYNNLALAVTLSHVNCSTSVPQKETHPLPFSFSVFQYHRGRVLCSCVFVRAFYSYFLLLLLLLAYRMCACIRWCSIFLRFLANLLIFSFFLVSVLPPISYSLFYSILISFFFEIAVREQRGCFRSEIGASRQGIETTTRYRNFHQDNFDNIPNMLYWVFRNVYVIKFRTFIRLKLFKILFVQHSEQSFNILDLSSKMRVILKYRNPRIAADLKNLENIKFPSLIFS